MDCIFILLLGCVLGGATVSGTSSWRAYIVDDFRAFLLTLPFCLRFPSFVCVCVSFVSFVFPPFLRDGSLIETFLSGL